MYALWSSCAYDNMILFLSLGPQTSYDTHMVVSPVISWCITPLNSLSIYIYIIYIYMYIIYIYIHTYVSIYMYIYPIYNKAGSYWSCFHPIHLHISLMIGLWWGPHRDPGAPCAPALGRAWRRGGGRGQRGAGGQRHQVREPAGKVQISGLTWLNYMVYGR